MKIEQYHSTKPNRTNLVLLAIAIALLCLIVATVQTVVEFKPEYERIRAEQEQMLDQLTIMQGELTQISEKVNSWQGVTITDDTMGTLWGGEK